MSFIHPDGTLTFHEYIEKRIFLARVLKYTGRPKIVRR